MLQNENSLLIFVSFITKYTVFQKKLSTTLIFASIPCPALFSASFSSFLSPPLLIGFSEDF